MSTAVRDSVAEKKPQRSFPLPGWIGLGLLITFWTLNWGLSGNRTFYTFFPLWLGYCLTMDALVLKRDGTSLLNRSWRKYISLFTISAPAWWLFELLNWRVQNWHYLGRELLNNWQYVLVSSINFSIVIPAIFETAEWVSGSSFIHRMKKGLIITPDQHTTTGFFIAGWLMLALMLTWPRYFFPFLWLSVYFIMEPINVWVGNRSLADYTRSGNWRPLFSLFIGALFTGFFWEMWNYYSYPKWVYTVPFVNVAHVFEMPVLGYGGYLPFALELFALYHLITGFIGNKTSRYIRLE